MPFDGSTFQNSQLLDDLLAARQLIQDPDNWCQYRLRNGHRFCARGALMKAIGFYEDDPGAGLDDVSHWNDQAMKSRFFRADEALGAYSRRRGYLSSAHLNNDESHREVIKMFDHAIADTRAKSTVSA